MSWMPYSIVSLITVFGDPSTIPLPVTTIPALFAKSSIIWNPIIYVARHNDFRRACLKFLPECCICKKIRHYDMANGPSTSRNLTEQILLEALSKIRNSRKPHNRLNQQYASSIISMDSTTVNRNLIRKTTPLTLKKQKNGSEIESEGNSGDFESCSSYENERLRIFDKNVNDFAKRILTSFENQSEESSIAIELDRQSEKNLDLEKERKPLLVNKPTRNKCIYVCASTMTDIGIQTSLDDSV